METTYTWDDIGDGATRMTPRNRGEPTGFAKLSTPMVAAAMRRANRKDLDRLKALLEQSTSVEGPTHSDTSRARRSG
jgi:hypothetical protein